MHGTTNEAPIARFARDEAHHLKLLGGRPAFGTLRELTCVVDKDCVFEVDTNSYSVPWRLIGERVAVTVAAGAVRIRHGSAEVAVRRQTPSRRQRIIDRAHLDGVAGRDGPVSRQIEGRQIEGLPIDPPPVPALLRPLAEYEAAAGRRF